MKESQSITNSLLMEVDLLSNRLINIKQSFKTTHNKGLKERLFSENKSIFKRIREIHKIAEILNKTATQKFNWLKKLKEHYMKINLRVIYFFIRSLSINNIAEG